MENNFVLSPGVALLHPLLQYGIVESIDLSSREELEIGYAGQHVHQTLAGQIGGCDIQFLQRTLVPLHLHDELRLKASAVHQQAGESLGTLHESLQSGTSHLVAEIDSEALQLDAVGAEGIDVRVVYEIDAI